MQRIFSRCRANHSTVAAANSGLDMEMWDGTNFGAPLKVAVQNGQVSMTTLNNMVHCILRITPGWNAPGLTSPFNQAVQVNGIEIL